MFSQAISRSRGVGAGILLGMTLVAAPALAQMQQKAPSPIPPPVTVTPAERATTDQVEGAVKNIDPGAGTLQVSYGPLGLFRRTIEVTDNTTIQVDGRQATLSDIREGEKVKASYERREEKNVATRVEVMPAEPGSKGATGK